MQPGTVKQVATIGFAALLLLGPARAEPSDDLDAPPGGSHAGANADRGADFNNVEVVDPVLGPKIELLRIGSQRGANGLLGVFAGLKNKTARQLELEIETIYKDKAGNDLNTGSWIHLTLAPNAEQDYRSSSISEAAEDFIIRVRRARAASH
jgi:hypothetical protein